MNKALSEMLNCLNTMGNLTRNDTDMSVLERQQARMKWQQEQSYFNGNEFNAFPIPSQAPQFEDLGLNNSCDSGGLNEFVNRIVKADPGLENGWQEFGKLVGSGSGFGSCVLGNGPELNYTLPRTTSCPPGMPGSDNRVAEAALPEKLTSAVGRESFKKRKHDKSQNLKAVLEDDTKEKRLKGCGDEEESKITEQNSNNDKKPNNKNNNNSNRETSADTSKDNSKVSEVQKPDYIHVRARRGQATDSHSLAERVRRERISERMKYLQDLVPGCNKITGKAGMLDEIINYVQSLQRQVEFLSMKLAAVNPSLDFNIDNFFTKEVLFPACTSNFPTIGVSSEMANQPYLQFNSLQQIVSCSELEMGINPPDTALRRTISAPISIPETFLDTSCFNQIHPSSAWDADFQNLYAMEFHQGRSTSFPCQQFSGSIEASSLKMEM